MEKIKEWLDLKEPGKSGKLTEVHEPRALDDSIVEFIFKQLHQELWKKEKNGKVHLKKNFFIWPAGTSGSEVWSWLDEHHTKGLDWLLSNIKMNQD